jgi:hypothetical protein
MRGAITSRAVRRRIWSTTSDRGRLRHLIVEFGHIDTDTATTADPAGVVADR